MKHFSLFALLLLAVVTISTIVANPPTLTEPAKNGQVQPPVQGQNTPLTQEDYQKCVDAAINKCQATNDELINLQHKNFNSTKPETWCFVHDSCVCSNRCLSNGDLDPTAFVNQQTSESDKKQVKDFVDECVKKNKNVENENERTYKQLACTLGN